MKLLLESGASVRVIAARSFFERALGLLGRKSLDQDTALLIAPCSSVHSFGMRFAIDVVFVSDQGRVLKVVERLTPWRAARCRDAVKVLELSAGIARHLGIAAGTQLNFQGR